MTRLILISFLLLQYLGANAQVVFKTFIKSGPVVEGESFRIQFILEDRPNSEFFPPDFTNFRVVNQPSVYPDATYGTGEKKNLKNIIYTLEALKPGKFTIPAASARVEDFYVKSEPVEVEVISKEEAAQREALTSRFNSTNAVYFLAPGEKASEKIRNNLFLKVMVDKKTCYVGEPVTATFKLYSRLVSRSDIVKNPGFYGFTVQDIVNLDSKQSGIETINGKKFDVHTVRKVQLYPLRAGSFNIDPMEVVTKVNFSRSVVNKNAEQEITEGVYPDHDPAPSKGIEVIENTMSSDVIPINVVAAPEKNRPDNFNGATGKFSINAHVSKYELAKNEEGELVITVSGKGNFTQLPVPQISWPQGIDGFDAEVKDQLDHDYSPMKGSRTFRFPFVSSKEGKYTIPSISFAFFDPDSNHYKTVNTQAVTINVSGEAKAVNKTIEEKAAPAIEKDYTGTILAVSLLVMMAIGAWIMWKRKLQEERAEQQRKLIKPEPIPSTVPEILGPASIVTGTSNKVFYTELRNCIWNYFAIYFNLSGSDVNRQSLRMAMTAKKVNEQTQQSILNILQECETGIFTDVDMEMNREELLKMTNEVLQEIHNS